jgi:CRISPR-associated protein Csd1
VLIQALCEYYDTLAAQGKLLSEGYSNVKISYRISLTPEGKIDGIPDCCTTETIKVKGGKEKEVKNPKAMILPKRTEKPGIESNIVEHRPLYIFGLNFDSKSGTLSVDDRTGKAKKSHAAFVEKSKAFFEGMTSPIAVAFLNFVNTWEPEKEENNPLLLGLGKELSTAGFVFSLSGHPEIMLQDDEEVKAHWESMLAETGDTDGDLQQCAIMGQPLPIARIHDKIKGIPGGSTMGNTLISFNNPAEYSYGHEQSYNSNISELAMKKYTQALNYLMAEKKHRVAIDDLIMFHWAANNNEQCDDLFMDELFGTDYFGEEKLDAVDTEAGIGEMLNKVSRATLNDDLDGILEKIDSNVDFYIVGIKPNSARLAVKFIYRRQFGEVFRNLVQHQLDLKISENSRPVSLNMIKKQLVSQKSSNQTVDSSLVTKVLESAIYGWRYPEFLLQTVVRRIQTDRDTETEQNIQMNPARMGILKACINRNDRLNGKEEEIKMALDIENKNPAYLCGRLFAVLENVQQRASGYGLNRTIKDAYFTSASTRPATVFPKLLTLSQHHMAKMDNDRYADESISQIVNELGSEFPNTLALKEQGIFMLGYYQQKQYIKDQISAYKEEK